MHTCPDCGRECWCREVEDSPGDPLDCAHRCPEDDWWDEDWFDDADDGEPEVRAQPDSVECL